MQFCNICRSAVSITTKQFHLNSNAVRSVSNSAVYSGRGRYKKIEGKNNTNSNSVDKFNPGVGRRLKLMKKDTPDIDSKSVLSEDDFEELEGDFMKSRQIHEEYERTMEKLKTRVKFKITERKFFKPAVEPNMLIWSEKEQIRLLHSEDPVEWNIDKLSASFPATAAIIKKILKTSWKPESVKRIEIHDKTVVENWKAFNEGKLVISCPVLKEHLKKFSKRVVLPRIPDTLKQLDNKYQKPQGTEFVNIIQSYKLLNESSERKAPEGSLDTVVPHEIAKVNANYQDIDTSVVRRVYSDESSEITNSKREVFVNNRSDYTLDKFRDTIRKKYVKSGAESMNELDRELLKDEMSTSSTNVRPLDSLEKVTVNESTAEIDVTKGIQTSEHQLQIRNSNTIQNEVSGNITKRIHIPKSKVKAGYLYKVNDCFYSHDGFFLYRVPGMITEGS